MARLNFSHGTHAEHLQMINRIKEVREELQIPLAIMLDTKGPEIRLRKIKNNEVFLHRDNAGSLLRTRWKATRSKLHHSGPHSRSITIGMRVLFDDGYVCSQVVETAPNGVWLQLENGGMICSGKGVNIPNTSLGLPAITDKDMEDIRFGCSQEIDIIAASFVRSADHVLEIKKLLAEEKRSDILGIGQNRK